MTNTSAGARGDSLSELLDEREHLLAIAAWMFDSPDVAAGIVRETHRRWYALTEDERGAITRPRAWLTRAAAEACLELMATAGADDATRMLWANPPPKPPDLLDLPQLAIYRQPSQPGQHARTTRQFATACHAGDDATLRDLLLPDAIVISDGGGTVRTPPRPIRGAADVARFVATLLSHEDRTGVTVEQVNGRAGIVLRRPPRVLAVVSLTVVDAKVAAVWIVLNPDKLRRWRKA